MTPLQAAWTSLVDRYPVGFDDFESSLEGWSVYPVHVGTKVAGAILVNGPEIHACILPFAKGKWFGKKAIRVMNDTIEKNGYAQTHATTQEGEEFVLRLGFVRHGQHFRRTAKWALKHL